MFYTYGPHAPTAYGNGPSIVEPQCEWILETMKRMTKNGQTKIDAQAQAEQDWKRNVNELHAKTFRDKVDSWYMGMKALNESILSITDSVCRCKHSRKTTTSTQLFRRTSHIYQDNQ